MGKGGKKDRMLYDAVKKGDTATVARLLSEGANPDAPVGKKGLTSMIRATALASRDIEKMLQEGGGTLHTSSTLRSPPASPAPLQQGQHADAGGGAASTVSTMVFRKQSEAVPPDDDSSANPLPVNMSRLALGVGSSVRLRLNPDTRATKLSELLSNEWRVTSSAMDLQFDFKRNWQFNRQQLQQVRKLGQGTFGVVFEGLAEGLLPGQQHTRVAVKMLTSTGETIREDFAKEVEIMKAIDGPHKIVRLLGVCTEEEPYLMIMELMERGDLKTVLRDSRPKDSAPSPLSFRRLALMGADIAEGMAFLASVRIVHRDLAARNILVAEDYTCKIGDFGMTRDVYQGDYYRMTGSAPLPIRWMSPEAIMDGVYSTHSDIWSFGVVLWELATFAKMPYAGMTNSEVCDKVTEEHYRLPIPRGCPPGFYKLMQQCWQEDCEKRGTFAQLQEKLKALASELPAGGVDKEKGSATLPSQNSSSNLGAAYATPEGAAEEAEPEKEYLKETEKNGEGALYTDQRYSHLDSMSLAIKYAMEQKSIQQVQEEKPVQHGIIKRQISETVAAEDAAAAAAKSTSPPAAAAPSKGTVATAASKLTTAAAVTATSPSSSSSATAAVATSTKTATASATATHRASYIEVEDGIPTSPTSPTSPTAKTMYTSLEAKSTPPPPRTTEESESRLSRKHQGGSTSRKHLANDHSDIASKVREASSATAEKAERDMHMWVEGTLGRELAGTLADVLRSGDVLCELLNKLKPGLVPKYHRNTRMAFKQMENIGWFIEGCKAFGVADSDLFMTVDLFEFANFRQVVICLGALRQRALSLGIRAM